MFDFQTKIKRQIEILGFCIYNSAQKPLRTIDLAEFFNVEELTIKRDLQDLRSYGIDIHSDKKRGVCLTSEPSREKIVEIILQYMSLSHNEYGIDKTTSLLVKKRGLNSLSNIVMLQRCIDNSAIAIIDYNKVGNKIDKGREIEPLLIIQHEGTWRLIAGSEGIIKQFILEKIVRVQTSDKKFKKESYNLSNLFNYSWKTWVSNEKFFIKLWLSKFWADRIEPRILVFEQKLTQNEDGSVIFECVVNSLNEIASWIVSRGEGVKVLEPKELREIVINLAIGALRNYPDFDNYSFPKKYAEL